MRVLRSTTSWGLGEDILAWRPQRDFHANLVKRCIEDGSIDGPDGRLIARLMGAMFQVQLSDWLERGMVESKDLVKSNVRDLLLHAFGGTRAPRRKR